MRLDPVPKEPLFGTTNSNLTQTWRRWFNVIFERFRRLDAGADVQPSGALRLAHLADADAETDTWYYSTDSSKPVYKDSGGTVHALY